MDTASSVQVISRGFKILRALRGNAEPMSLGEIARAVDLPKSTVQRIVSALIEERVMEPAKRTKGFRLSAGFYALTVQNDDDVRRSLRSVLDELSIATGETIDLARYVDRQLVFIDQVQGKSRLSAFSAIGEVFPLSNTANGHAVLRLLSQKERNACYAFEGLNVDEIERLETTFETAITPWFGKDLDQKDEGISALGLGFKVHNLGYFAISVVAPSFRFWEKRPLIEAELSKAVQAVQDLGFEC